MESYAGPFIVFIFIVAPVIGAIIALISSLKTQKYYREHPEECQKKLEEYKAVVEKKNKLSAARVTASNSDESYIALGAFFGLITFVISYIYCIFNYGFLFGFVLGWLPSMFLAVIVGAVWPILFIFIFILGVVWKK